MKNEIIDELRDTRKKLDKEFENHPEKVHERWKRIEKKFDAKIVQRNPKYLKKTAA